jgi:predicted GNAT family acetyltransferase
VSAVVDNVERRRFELEEAGELAFANYRREPGKLIIPHVEAALPLRGTGAAGRLIEGVLAIARAQGLRVAPYCSYASAYIRRHREHHDLLG